MSKSWMVRAERDGRLFDAFKEKSAVAIGWNGVGDLSAVKTRKGIADLVASAWPDSKPQSNAMAAGQLHRFVNEIEVGDMVVTYNPSRRVYLIGEIAGPYRYDTSIDLEDAQYRPVHWQGEVSRDLLSVESRNSLGGDLNVIPDLERGGCRTQEGTRIRATDEARGGCCDYRDGRR